MKDFLSAVLVLAFVYAAISLIVLRFKHPWMTETEALLNFHNAVLFKSVKYEEARPR